MAELLPLLAVVDSSTVMQAFFGLMAIGGFGFLLLTREKK